MELLKKIGSLLKNCVNRSDLHIVAVRTEHLTRKICSIRSVLYNGTGVADHLCDANCCDRSFYHLIGVHELYLVYPYS